ncbi:MAG TPA: VOC family protein [Methylomirabilota bacterium]|jgi:uncharacterized glyoxalase superfamily protein PhnB|nr:VOC family protein [Methylomirabilota bacterium]
MAVKAIPDGYHSVTPYLIVKGAARLIEFLEQVFGATELMRTTGGGGGLHAEVRIGDSVIMMGEGAAQGEMPAAIYLYVDDADGAYQRALGAGATSLEAPTDTLYGDRRAGVRDPFGNRWFIATHKEDVPPDEIARRQDALRRSSAASR